MQMLGIAQKPSQTAHPAEAMAAAILQLISDPKTAEGIIAELQKQREQCNAAFSQANKVIKDANEKLADIEQREHDLADQGQELDDELAKLAAGKAVLAEDIANWQASQAAIAQALDARRKAVADEESNLAQRIADAETKNNELAKREDALAKKEAAAQALMQEYQDKLTKIRALAG